MENIAIYFHLGGAVLLALAALWLIILAFREKLWWGLGVLLLLPVVGLVFACAYWKKSRWPVLLGVLGVLSIVAPAVYTRLMPVDLGPREQMVQGKLRITLTGWDRNDYSVLQQKKEVQELEMANADVTDQTLEQLRGLDQLEYLDLSNSQITDEGLKVLAELPRLEKLFVDNTKITDRGLEEHLAPLKSLKLVSAQRTEVTPNGAKAFKTSGAGRKIRR